MLGVFLMKKVLILNPHYLPGFKSGGPQQTVQNICNIFSNISDIYLVTLDHDLGETESYDVKTGKWLELYGIKIMYVGEDKYNLNLFQKLYNGFETIYACGLFCKNTYLIIWINFFKKNKHKIYVAPMGVFSKNAMAVKKRKKNLFLKVFSLMGAFKKIIWSFTSEEELQEATEVVGKKNIKEYIIAEDLPRFIDFDKAKKNVQEKRNPLKIVFLSRIVPKKNLLYALEILNQRFTDNIEFDIYGLLEDKSYWEQCKQAMDKLPPNIICRYRRSVRPEESIQVFSQYDVFLFPTQGENFGHVIYEALAAGCIPIISDTTPWKDLEKKKCGSVVELSNIDGFKVAIQSYLECPESDFLQYKMNAIGYAENRYILSVKNSGYKKVFE